MTQTTDAGRSDPTTNFMLMSERAFKQRDAALAAVADLVKALEGIAELSKPGQEVSVTQAVDLLCDVWNVSCAALAAAKGVQP